MILYLSGTGNSLWAARTIAGQTGDRLLSIPDLLRGGASVALSLDERLGFVVPVHGWRPPQIVRRLVASGIIVCKPDTYIYVLYTAGDSIGKAAEYIAADMRRAGLHLDAAFSLIMPESYVGLPFMDVDSPSREREKIQQASEDIRGYMDDIQMRRKVTKTTRGPLPGFFSGCVGGVFVRWIITDKPFRVETERCSRCGLCASVCPVRNIKGGKGHTPQWLHTGECMSCMACYHHCPHHAIEYGGRTRNKGQYFFKDKV